MKLMTCNHSKLSQILFGDLEVQTVSDKKKNVIDVVKNGKDAIAIVIPSQDQARRPGVIHLTSRTRRPRPSGIAFDRISAYRVALGNSMLKGIHEPNGVL